MFSDFLILQYIKLLVLNIGQILQRFANIKFPR